VDLLRRVGQPIFLFIVNFVLFLFPQKLDRGHFAPCTSSALVAAGLPSTAQNFLLLAIVVPPPPLTQVRFFRLPLSKVLWAGHTAWLLLSQRPDILFPAETSFHVRTSRPNGAGPSTYRSFSTTPGDLSPLFWRLRANYRIRVFLFFDASCGLPRFNRRGTL